jgi:hypothetical protein
LRDDGGDVDQLEGRIGGRLQHDEPGVVADARGDLVLMTEGDLGTEHGRSEQVIGAPQSGRTATTCGFPMETVCAITTAVIAAMPDAKAAAASACSSAASASSKRATVGFHRRA